MLRPHSTLFKKQINVQSHTYYLEGEAYFDVVKNENRTFNVYTESGIVEVLGTEFNLRTWDNSTDVYLKTGSLRLSSTDVNTPGVLLSPGEFSSLKNDQPISAPQTADEKLFTSWRNNEIIFTNRTAKSIFNELEHHYSITIVAPEYINSEILGGSLSLENTAQSLRNLGTVLGGQFVLSGTNTYKFVSSE
jgi:ferric-dicitrate binding protein FerR (iron transport regulator)